MNDKVWDTSYEIWAYQETQGDSITPSQEEVGGSIIEGVYIYTFLALLYHPFSSLSRFVCPPTLDQNSNFNYWLFWVTTACCCWFLCLFGCLLFQVFLWAGLRVCFALPSFPMFPKPRTASITPFTNCYDFFLVRISWKRVPGHFLQCSAFSMREK